MLIKVLFTINVSKIVENSKEIEFKDAIIINLDWLPSEIYMKY